MIDKHSQGVTGIVATASGFAISHWPTVGDFLHDIGSVVAIVAGLFTMLYYFEAWRKLRKERTQKQNQHHNYHGKH